MLPLNQLKQLEAINMAAEFSARAHGDYTHTGALQTRKCGIIPYSAHPAYVALLVTMYGGSPNAQIAAYLHDVLEDCDLEWATQCEKLVLSELPLPVCHCDDIWDMVCSLTKTKSAKPRSERNIEMIDRIMDGADEVVLIKICDRLANLMHFDGLTLEFLEQTYIPETEVLIRAIAPRANAYPEPYHMLIERVKNIKSIFQ